MYEILSNVFISIFFLYNLLIIYVIKHVKSDIGVKGGVVHTLYAFLALAIFFALKAKGIL